MVVTDVIIIGAGPAGLAAAGQTRRYALTTRVLEDGSAGGLLWNANRVENYPGFPNGIRGRDLAQLFVTHAESAGIPVTPERVIELDWENGLFRAVTPEGVYHSRAAVIASGTAPRVLTGFDISDAVKERVVYEIRSLLDVEGACFVIVGAGDAAYDYALSLGERNSVVIVSRGKGVRSLVLLRERAGSCRNITHRANTTVSRLEAAGDSRPVVECSGPDGGFTLRADYLVGAIGRDPRIDFVSENVRERSSDLERRGILHFAGDVKNGMFRQTAIAVGNGVLAAMRTYQALKGP